MNIDDVNVKILESLKEEGQKGEHQEVIGELEQQGELPKDVQKGGEQYENKEPRQG